MAMLGLIGGPLVAASGLAVLFDAWEQTSAWSAIATIPEFVWELSLGIYLVVKGFRPSPILADDLTESGRRPGDGERAVPAARRTAGPAGDAPPAERP